MFKQNNKSEIEKRYGYEQGNLCPECKHIIGTNTMCSDCARFRSSLKTATNSKEALKLIKEAKKGDIIVYNERTKEDSNIVIINGVPIRRDSVFYQGFQSGLLKAKDEIKCTGCGKIPTLCNKCSQDICANAQEDVAEQVKDEIIKMIENEKVYPDYQEFKQPAEAITQFKIKLKQKISKEIK